MCLWVDAPAEVYQSSQLPAWIDKIELQTHKPVYWMELTEPTFANLLAGIDRVLSGGCGYYMLVGGTGLGTRLLQDNPKE